MCNSQHSHYFSLFILIASFCPFLFSIPFFLDTLSFFFFFKANVFGLLRKSDTMFVIISRIVVSYRDGSFFFYTKKLQIHIYSKFYYFGLWINFQIKHENDIPYILCSDFQTSSHLDREWGKFLVEMLREEEMFLNKESLISLKMTAMKLASGLKKDLNSSNNSVSVRGWPSRLVSFLP